MNRPTTEEDYNSFMIKASWVSEKFVEPVSIEVKGYHYPHYGKAFLEIKHLLDIFYKGSKVKWNIKDFLKNNREKFEHMFTFLEIAWDNNVIPSYKALAYYHSTTDIPRYNPNIRQEWTISIFAAVGMLLTMSGTRRVEYERDRAQAMLAGMMEELLHIELWTFEFFMKFLDDAKLECPHRHTNNFCYHVHNDVMEWLTNSRIVGSPQKVCLCVSDFTKVEFLTNNENQTWLPKIPV